MEYPGGGVDIDPGKNSQCRGGAGGDPGGGEISARRAPTLMEIGQKTSICVVDLKKYPTRLALYGGLPHPPGGPESYLTPPGGTAVKGGGTSS